MKKKKKRLIRFSLLQAYNSTIIFAYFDGFFLKIPMLKNFSSKEGTSPTGLSINPTCIEIMQYLTVANINKSFKFEND